MRVIHINKYNNNNLSHAKTITGNYNVFFFFTKDMFIVYMLV